MEPASGWRPPQADSGGGGEAPSADWRSQLQADSRRRIVNKIMDTLKKHLPISVPEGLSELEKIAIRFEEKIYSAAIDQSDYLRKISLKMLSMETRTQAPTTINPAASNSAIGNQSTADSASLGLQPQVNNQGQSLAMPVVNQSSLRQPLMSQNFPNKVPSTSVQGSASLPTSVTMSGISQSTLSSVVQASNLQNMTAVSQNSIGNSLQGNAANLYPNTQRQVTGRQQPLSAMSQHQQQSQNSLIYQHQMQQQLMKQKIPLPSLLQPHVQQPQQQQQQQQQPLMQSNQQPLMQMPSNVQAGQSSLLQTQPTLMQSGTQSGLQQNQPNPMQQSVPSLLQQHPPYLARQQQAQATIHQQQSSLQQQSSSGAQQSLLSPQQQQLIGQQSNISNMQQSQMHGQQNGMPDLQQQQLQQQQLQQQQLQQQQQQQQQRLSGQQSGLLGIQQPQQILGQQNSGLQQQLGQQNNLSGLQQQQQQQLAPQGNVSGLQQQQQLLGAQSNVPALQQQQQLAPQSSLSGLQQPQLGSQGSLSAMQQQLATQHGVSGLQQQQQQLLGSQSTMSSLQPNQRPMQMLHQSKAAVQQPTQQPSLTMLQTQNQQTQITQAQQPMPPLQPQNGQLQHQFGVQQQTNPLLREMQQKFQPSGPLLQSQNPVDQQKQFIQSQRAVPEVSSSTSLDSTAQTGQAGAADWQEEIYQKIKAMKDSYLSELSELNQKLNLKFQQAEMMSQPGKQPDNFEKLKNFKLTLERCIQFLQISKSSILPAYKEKLPQYEKHIATFIASHRNKKVPPSQPQQQFQPPGVNALSLPQQQQAPQVPQLQQHDSVANQSQQMNLQNSVASLQPSSTPSLPLSTQVGAPTMQQSIANPLQPSSNLDPGQGNSFSSRQQGSVGGEQQNVGSLQTAMNLPSQNMNSSSHNAMNSMQPTVNSMQPNVNSLQQQHLKQQQQQEQQLMQNQQIKQQLQQRHIQQQILQQQQKQQMLQQQQQQQSISQQLIQQQRQQQVSQMSQLHQMPQLHQMNEDIKIRQASGIKPGLYPQHFAAGQRNFYNQPLKASTNFPISSPQNIQASSPQISQHSSPHIDQHALLSSHPKTGTPLQSASSPFVVPSPSTPVTRSPVPTDSEKQIPMNLAVQQTTILPTQPQSLSVGTPGISASPLLAEFITPEGNQANALTIPGKLSGSEQPLDRLIRAVQSLSPTVLSSSISDIGSVVSMTDRIAGSAPGNGSRAAVGEDLVAMTKCRLQARNFMSQDGSTMTKKMKRHTSAMPSNVVASVGSVDDSFRHSFSLDTNELESTATSSTKKQKVEVSHYLLEEIRDINKRLIDTVVSISEEDADSVAASAGGGGEGTVVKCSFGAVALSPGLKSQFVSAQMSPILPLRLLIPANYPKCSPVLLDKLPLETSQAFEDPSTKAKSRFSVSLRGLPQPMSLGEMARTWDMCARMVITEYAQHMGGGSFSSTYGVWENCVSAA